MSDGRFKKGQIPWNKGKRYKLENHTNVTSFKSAEKHPRYRPIGSTRVDKDNYIIIKTADNKWQPKHRYLWEQHYKKRVPNGHVVLFGDGNNRNFKIENLLLISRRQLAILNKKYKQTYDGKLNEVVLNMIDLELAIKDRSQNGKSG